MKKHKYIYAIICAILFSLSSCDLERLPKNEFEDSDIWASESNALLALTGIYRGNIQYNGPEYQPKDWWSYSGLLFLEFASDNAYDRRGTNSGFHRMTDGTLLPDNGFIHEYWSNSYSKIGRANRFLEGIDKLDASDAVKNRFKAEARFLRAAQYFYLSQFFGSVPIVTRSLTMVEANTVELNTKAEVVDFTIKELSESVEHLPRFKDLKVDSEAGRASKQVALAFLGRLCLAEKKYGEAAAAYKQIIDFGDNIIDPNYASVFLPQNENSKENIFSTQYLEGTAGNGLPQHAFPVMSRGWCLINVAGSLAEAYTFSDGTPFSYSDPRYDANNLGKDRDPRMDYTIYYNGATFMNQAYICHPDAASGDKISSGQTTQTGFLMRKYFDETYTGDLNRYGVNFPIIRYAEVLLGYLEAKLENGEGIDQTLLDNTVNQLRTRPSVDMPKVTETNADALRPILRKERRVELAMEGIRYWDLLRWGIAHEELTQNIMGAPFPGSVRVSKLPDGTLDKHGRWYVGKRNFRKEKDYKWPIPQREQDINPNLRN